MKHCYRLPDFHRVRQLLDGALLLAVVCGGILGFASTAQADDPARVRDAVYGDIRVLEWSQGNWLRNGSGLPGCVTFVGGVSTGPGNTYSVDSLVCDPMPTDWRWSVTLPSGATLQWGVDNMPLGVEVCAQIFYSREHPYILGKADIEDDHLTVADGLLNTVLYDGPLSTFDPEEEGFIPTQGRRCGIILPLPTGACCFTDGRCEIDYQSHCDELGGVYQGDGIECEPNPCPQPPGACCFPDGHCEYVTVEVCVRLGGVPQGYGTVCDPNPCVQPPMACCFPDGHCEFVLAATCRQLGGVPQGYGTVCDPNPCPQPPMACCFPDGHCEFVTADICSQLGGVPQGYGTVCDPNPCPQPPEACCFPDCSCQMLTAAICAQQGGIPLGPGTDCDPNPCDCPPPTGACCIGDQGDCQLLSEAECLAQGGTFQGVGSTCEPVNPCPIVPTQNTTWGKIKNSYR
jgi:hypothetical protein